MRPVLNPVAHELAGALRFVGLRDRLRCPACEKIGTWKPHGGLWDRWHDHDRAVRRWLCKWCGYYKGPEGELYAFPSRQTGAWALPGWATDQGETLETDVTPEEAVLAHYKRPVNPWAG